LGLEEHLTGGAVDDRDRLTREVDEDRRPCAPGAAPGPGRHATGGSSHRSGCTAARSGSLPCTRTRADEASRPYGASPSSPHGSSASAAAAGSRSTAPLAERVAPPTPCP